MMVTATSLVDAIKQVSAASKSKAKDVLSYVRLSSDGGKLEVLATNLDQWLSVTIESEGDDIACLIPPDKVCRLLAFVDDTCTIVLLNGDGLLLSAGSVRSELSTQDVSEFPSRPSFKPKYEVVVPSNVLRDAIRKTSFCVDPSATRYALSGVLLTCSEESLLHVVATDGRRMSAVRFPGAHNCIMSAIVPETAISMLQGMIGSGDVRIVGDHDQIMFESPNCALHTKLLSGRFPAWDRVLPNVDSYPSSIVNAQLLSRAINQACAFCTAESASIDLCFTRSSCIVSSASETGKADIDVACDGDIELKKVTVNSNYVLQYLRAAEKEVRVYAKNENEALLFESVETGALSQYMLMPMARG